MGVRISQNSKVNQPNQGHQPWQSNSLILCLPGTRLGEPLRPMALGAGPLCETFDILFCTHEWPHYHPLFSKNTLGRAPF